MEHELPRLVRSAGYYVGDEFGLSERVLLELSRVLLAVEVRWCEWNQEYRV